MALVLSLTGCEEMFVREIDFTAEKEPEMLVLSGSNLIGLPPAFHIFHSFFFGHTPPTPKNVGGVSDAEVTIRVNSGEWMQLFPSSANGYSYSRLADGSTAPALMPLDTVEINVSHPEYPTLTGYQVMPDYVNGRYVSIHVQPNFWVDITIELDPYQGNEDDVIGITFTDGTISLTGPNTKKPLTLQITGLYSVDPVFAKAINMSSGGYYGAMMDDPLFFPASELQQARQIHLIADAQWGGRNKDWYNHCDLKSMTLNLRAYTRDAYLFTQSKRLLLDREEYLAPPSDIEDADENIMQDILDDLKEVLGDQEPVQVYTNVQGGLGHLCGHSNKALRLPK